MHSELSFRTKSLGLQLYESVWQDMKHFTDQRTSTTPDEVWFVEHPPVFTQGQAGKPEHVLASGDIPIVQTDRGGQVTFHGPGQLVVYPLLDLRRRKLGVRELVTRIENSVVRLLAKYDIKSAPKADAPGVYIEDDKIASLGLRVRKGCRFHGVAINVSMDLSPFLRINPCGYEQLRMTQIANVVDNVPSVAQVANDYTQILNEALLEVIEPTS